MLYPTGYNMAQWLVIIYTNINYAYIIIFGLMELVVITVMYVMPFILHTALNEHQQEEKNINIKKSSVYKASGQIIDSMLFIIPYFLNLNDISKYMLIIILGKYFIDNQINNIRNI